MADQRLHTEAARQWHDAENQPCRAGALELLSLKRARGRCHPLLAFLTCPALAAVPFAASETAGFKHPIESPGELATLWMDVYVYIYIWIYRMNQHCNFFWLAYQVCF